MIQLNLLPDVKKEFLRAQRLKRNIISGAVIVSIASIGLVALLALYVHGAQVLARNQLQSDINKSSQQLQSIKNLSKILTVQNALAALPGLHDKDPVNSRLFDYLKVLIPNDVSLTKVELSHDDSSIKISGNAAGYKSLNIFVDALKNAQLGYGPHDSRTTTKAFDKVTIATAGKSSDPKNPGVEFSLSMVFTEKLFDSQSTSPAVNVPSVTTGEGFVKTSGTAFQDSTNQGSGGTQ